jgi:hypothetical protein
MIVPGGASAWDPPATVAGGGDPILEDLDMSPNGEAFAAWTRRAGNRGLVASRFAAGEWEAGQSLHDGPNEAFTTRLANDGQGRTFVVYQVIGYGSEYQEVTTWARETTGASWGPPTQLGLGSPEVGGLAVAASPDGSAVAVWNRQQFLWYSEVSAARYVPGTGWNATGPLGVGSQPRVAMDEGGNATIAWTHSEEGFDGVWVARFDPVTGWTLPEQIERGNAQGVRVAMSRGRTLAAWTRSDELGVRFWWAIREASAGWSTPQRVSFDAATDSGWIGGGGVQLATNRAGNGLAVFQVFGVSGTTLWTAGVDSLAIGSTRRIASGESASVAVNSRGDTAIAWIDQGGVVAQTRAALEGRCTARVSQRSAEGPNVLAPDVGVDEAGRALATWSEQDRGRLSIRFSAHQVVPECWGSPSTGIAIPAVLAASVLAATSVSLLLKRSGRRSRVGP